MADDEHGKKAPRQRMVANAEGNVMVDVLMGPYRGNRLTMTEADGQAAVNGHWARDPNDEYGDHDPLTDQERTDAYTAAQTWAQAQWDAAQGVTPPEPPVRKTMEPDKGAGYATRQMETPKHPEPPRR